ncbi:hypothetical protein MYCTH_2124694 [Thermothelomyces thermophilus ATCC 42464]|uniref:Uncharacterized protein n=1 Tax=Thermothelomyces thermophilus (strain ATCC 42464 / BCRC 31852 / DSM 1799) TaxID=573729 RepID=G2Q064_THET4|nr:uncharacterized protein MYCTH_2124694 [Thermothelomyces thermophilus ATCC 42464]AEO55738.1 hypothetical protein MYCTH_2124694 [Thermothelomyces thermophilus ATCC 42464]
MKGDSANRPADVGPSSHVRRSYLFALSSDRRRERGSCITAAIIFPLTGLIALDYHLSPDRWGQNPRTPRYGRTGARPNPNRLVYGPPNGSLPLKLATEPAVYPIERNPVYGTRLNYSRLERPRILDFQPPVATQLEDLGRFETTKIPPSKDTRTGSSNLVLSLPKIFSKMLPTAYGHVVILLALLSSKQTDSRPSSR